MRFTGILAPTLGSSWKAQISCRKDRGVENLQIRGFETEAEAAVGFDLLNIWRQRGRTGSKVEPRKPPQFNFPYANYAALVLKLQACGSAAVVKQMVKDLLREGKLRALVPADGKRASPVAAASPGKRKRSGEAPRRRDHVAQPAQPAQPGRRMGADGSGELQRRTRRGAPGGEFKPQEQRAAPPKKAAPVVYGGEIVAARIKVFWPLENSWFTGWVTDFDAASRRHKVEYDDGDVQLLDLSAERVEVQGGAGEQTRTNSPLQPRRSRAPESPGRPLPSALRARRDGGDAGRQQQQAAAQQQQQQEGRTQEGQLFEEMYANVKRLLLGVPDLEASIVSAFLSSFVQLHEARRVQHDQLMLWAGQGRLELVREWVLRAEELY